MCDHIISSCACLFVMMTVMIRGGVGGSSFCVCVDIVELDGKDCLVI